MRIKSITCGLIILGTAGLLYSGWSYFNRPKPARQIAGMQLDAAPSAKKPSAAAVANYSVPADQPRYVTIPAIAVSQARIIRLGRLANGQITTPDNIYDTGWYEDSAKPGQSGAMFVFGHVSSWTADGVFYNLKRLRPGDAVTVARGDGKTFTYRVVSSKMYDYQHVDMQQVLSPIAPGTPGLNLMTCAGSIITGTNGFNERLVVFTSLVKS